MGIGAMRRSAASSRRDESSGVTAGADWPATLMVGAVLASSLITVTAAEPVGAAPRYGRFCSSGAPIRSVATSQRVVAFTFDDGPSPSNTSSVMSTFERYGWRASFYVVGGSVRAYPDLARSIVARGHGIAGHSMTHQYSPSTIAREVVPTRDLIEAVTGVRTTFFRSPGLTHQLDHRPGHLRRRHVQHLNRVRPR